MREATLVLLGGTADLNRWAGALDGIQAASIACERIVANATAAPFAALVAGGYSSLDVAQRWNEFEAHEKGHAITGKEVCEWVGELLEDKGIKTFGDLKAHAGPELKMVVRDVADKSGILLPDEAWKLGLEPDSLSIAEVVQASMAVPGVESLAQVELGSRTLTGSVVKRETDWKWEQIIKAATMPLVFFADPILLSGVRGLVSRALSPRYRNLVKLDEAIANSDFARQVDFSELEIDEAISGAKPGSRSPSLIRLQPTRKWSLNSAKITDEARTETLRGLSEQGLISYFPERRTAGSGGLYAAGGGPPIVIGEPVATPRQPAATSASAPPATTPVPVSPASAVAAGGALVAGGSGMEGQPPNDTDGTAGSEGDRGGQEGTGTISRDVFAKIEVSDEQPEQDSQITATVSLGFTEDPKTFSSVYTAADTEEHEFEVHLLLGQESRWEKLKFQRPKETTASAEFKGLKTPVFQPDDNNQIPDHQMYQIYVNFFLRNRWCGEAGRFIRVRAGKESARAAAIPKPKVPEWRKNLVVAPGTPPPDLLIRIKQIDALKYEWQMFSPHRSFPRDGKMTVTLSEEPYTYVKNHFERFAGVKELTKDQIYDLEAECTLIHEMAPEGFRQGYSDLCREVASDKTGRIRLQTIQIVSDEPFIPWELMRVEDRADKPAFPPEILCVKHAVGRWMARDSTRLSNSLAVEKIAVAASDYKTMNVGNLAVLEWAAEERKFLTGAPYKAIEIQLRLPDILTFLQTGEAEMIHFSCHGKTDVQVPDQATLNTEDDELRAPLVATPEVRQGVGKYHPVVFLNACQAAGAGKLTGMVFGWPQAFLQMGATACIAPLWKVIDERAKEISESFYEGVLLGKAGEPPKALGESLQGIRAQWKDKKSITHLGYVLYGDPSTKVAWLGGAGGHPRKPTDVRG